MPGAVRDDGGEARRVAKRAVAAMFIAYGQIASAATRAAMSEHGRPEDFARAMSRLNRGEAPEDAIDDRLLAPTPRQQLACDPVPPTRVGVTVTLPAQQPSRPLALATMIFAPSAFSDKTDLAHHRKLPRASYG